MNRSYRPARHSAIIIFAIFLLGLSACSFGPLARGNRPGYYEIACSSVGESGATSYIYVINLGWHTGIAISALDLDPKLAPLIEEDQQSPWLEFGWGDRDFYLSSGYSYWLAFRAAFFSTASALQIARFSQPPRLFFQDSLVIRVQISRSGSQALSTKILETLLLDSNGRAKRIAPSLYGSGGFYNATGKFSLFYTCNSWAAEMLHAAGCPIEPNLLRASSISQQLLQLRQ